MKRIIALTLILILLLLPFGAQQTTTAQEPTQTISTLSGRITVSYPADWSASNAVQTDLQNLFASEALTIAQDAETLQKVALGPNIGGTHLVFATFPTLEIFPLNPNPNDFSEVTNLLFGQGNENVEPLEIGGYPAARYHQPDGISFTVIGLGSILMTISAQIVDDSHIPIVDGILASLQITVPQNRFALDNLTHPLSSIDQRVNFQTGEGWYYGSRGQVVYTAPLPSPIQDFSFDLVSLSALESPFFAVIPRSYSEFFEPDRVVNETDLRTILDLTLSELTALPEGEFASTTVSGFPAVSSNATIGANSGTVIAVDAGHTIYMFIRFYATAAAGEYAPLMDTLMNSVSITPLSPEIAALPPEGLREGFRAPNLSATMLDGSDLQLSDLQGQIVMLNFWFTTCPPCREEMPNIQAAYNQYNSQGFTVLAINNREIPVLILPYLNELNLSLPVVLDVSGVVQGQYGIWNYPTSIFIDRQGIIYGMQLGPISVEQMTAFIETGLSR